MRKTDTEVIKRKKWKGKLLSEDEEKSLELKSSKIRIDRNRSKTQGYKKKMSIKMVFKQCRISL